MAIEGPRACVGRVARLVLCMLCRKECLIVCVCVCLLFTRANCPTTNMKPDKGTSDGFHPLARLIGQLLAMCRS